MTLRYLATRVLLSVTTNVTAYDWWLPRHQAPDFDATVNMPYQQAIANVVAALRVCAPYPRVAETTVYPDLGRAEVVVWQADPDTVLLAVYRAESGPATKLTAWGAQAAFGSGYEHLGRSAGILARDGAKTDCAKAGF